MYEWTIKTSVTITVNMCIKEPFKGQVQYLQISCKVFNRQCHAGVCSLLKSHCNFVMKNNKNTSSLVLVLPNFLRDLVHEFIHYILLFLYQKQKIIRQNWNRLSSVHIDGNCWSLRYTGYIYLCFKSVF